MKQKDIALIILIGFISAVVSFLASTRIFVTPANRQQTVEVVDAINPDFERPDSKYFNSNSLNIARTTELGGDTNQTPFNSTQR
ncbi:MAG: hypothetical protein WBP03_00870 [Candidatus Saccharimonadales bacterium]|jgi:hypothetical protein